jgi:isoquinoline 1-oxidoreductase beta subunit
VREAALLGRRIGTLVEGPVQLVWSREDDLRHDTFRDAAVVIAHGVAGPGGDVRALGFAVGTPAADPSSLASFMVEGLVTHGYAIGSRRVAWSGITLPVRTGIWRSVAHSYTAFAKEHALDVLVRRAGGDPVEARRALSSTSPRLHAVLDRAVTRASTHPLEDGAGRGVAAHACFGSFVAQVADVRVEDGRVRVLRVVVAIDCGRVVSPDLVRQQIEGGVIFGLSAALHGRVPIRDGAPTITSFADYPILRMGEAPDLDVEIVESDADPSGVGELAVPCIAPAVANALLALGLAPQRGLPLRVG